MRTRNGKRLRWYWRPPSGFSSWHPDETYIKVNGRWAYLYPAFDGKGRSIDFYLSPHRNSKAAYRFLGKILNNMKGGQRPRLINTDKVRHRAVRSPGSNAKTAFLLHPHTALVTSKWLCSYCITCMVTMALM